MGVKIIYKYRFLAVELLALQYGSELHMEDMSVFFHSMGSCLWMQ